MVAPPSLSRRSFLKISTGGFAVGSVMSLVDVRSAQARAQSLKTAGVKEIPSVCPYCAVGCGMLVGVKDGKIINIEGNPDSPINRGTLCPKGAASFQLAVNPLRSTKALYRRPGGSNWEEILSQSSRFRRPKIVLRGPRRIRHQCQPRVLRNCAKIT